MKRLLALTMAVAIGVSAIGGCTQTPKETEAVESITTIGETKSESVAAETKEEGQSAEAIRVAALKGPTAMGMVKVMEDDGKKDKSEYDFSIMATVDEIAPKLSQGQLDISAVPANMASVLYNNTEGGIYVLAINTLGVLYVVEKGETIQSIEDLKGKTIYATGKGATPEYALNYILSANGISSTDDLTIEYKSEPAECLAMLTENENGIAMLPQPFVTTAQAKDDGIRIALDLTKEWESVQDAEGTDSALITGVLVGRKEFVDANPEKVQAFLEEYKKSVDYVNANIEEASILIGDLDIVPAAVAAKAIPYCNISYIDGEEMKTKLSGYLDALWKQNPKSVGGELPKDDFYFQ